MLKLNNKGQSLVMFIIIIPIFVLLFTLVYDVGSAIYEKNKLSNINYMVVEYGLSNIDTVNTDDLTDLINKNDSDIDDISIFIDNNVINIKLTKESHGLIGNLFKFNLVDITSQYEGEIVDDKKRIERIK